MRKSIIIALIAVSCLCLLASERPARSSCSLDGVYQSDWGNVFLTEQGSSVSGTWKSGTVSGTREGDTIRYTWYNGTILGGHGYWEVSPDCSRLSGPWGTGDNETGGGSWNLHK
jgi:hypothetical protein